MELLLPVVLVHSVLGIGVVFDALGRDAPERVWFAIAFLTGVVGVLLYYAVVVYE